MYGGYHGNNNNFKTEKQCPNGCTICGGKYFKDPF